MAKFKNPFKRKEDKPKKRSPKKKKIIIIVIILALVIVGFFACKGMAKKDVAAEVHTAKATRGDLAVRISGTGTIEANEQYEITSLVKGTVLSANFEEGQLVQKDQVLYTIDTSDMQNSIEKSKNALEKSQMTYDQAAESISNLNVYSNITGVVTSVYIKKGDNISNNAKVIDVTDTETMLLKIPFNTNDISSIYVGASADVTLENSSFPLNGTVSKIASGSSVSDEGASVTMVTIQVQNPGGIKKGDTATAVVGGVACNTAGAFEENESSTVLAKTAGEVSWISVDVGDKVTSGQKIAQLTSTSLNDQLKSSQLSVKDSQLGIESLYDQLEDYTIKSPISGTIVKKTTKAGDKLDTSTTKEVMAIVADLSKILFKINVDELDIAKMQVGQSVDITADALPNQKFTGYVDYVSIVGTTTNGVTTYPVTVVVNDPEGLIPGMNVEADIVVESKSDVLQVPVDAINRGNIVYVKDGSSNGAPAAQGEKPDSTSPEAGGVKTDRGGNAGGASGAAAFGGTGGVPAGFKSVRVEVGLSNSDMVEIISGLQEGDEVYVTAQTMNANNMQMMMMGAPAGGDPSGGGGAPSGGGPSGGGAPGGGGR